MKIQNQKSDNMIQNLAHHTLVNQLMNNKVKFLFYKNLRIGATFRFEKKWCLKLSELNYISEQHNFKMYNTASSDMVVMVFAKEYPSEQSLSVFVLKHILNTRQAGKKDVEEFRKARQELHRFRIE